MFSFENIKFREIKKSEYAELELFLYEAIFIPEGILSPSREIIFKPELQVYIKNFGEGIATALMNKLLKKIFSEKFTQVSLSVQKSNEIALKFYEKLGFKIFYENKSSDDIIMTLKKV